MALNSELRRSDRFVGDGSQAAFPFEFKVFSGDQVKVTVANLDGIEEVLSNASFSVSISGDQDNNPGGSVNLNSPLPAGFVLVIQSAVPSLQPAVFTNRGGFYPATLNDCLDRVTILCQQLQEELSRTLIVPVTENKTPAELISEILDVAAKANEYAKQSQEVLVSVKQSEEFVREKSEAVSEAKESVDASKERIEVLAKAVDDNQENLQAFNENLDSLHVVIENKASIQAIASDLQGFPIEGFDGGWTDEADEVLIGVGGVMRDCAENIEAIKTIAEALEGVMNLEDLEAEVTEIGATDYVKINNTGVVGA